MNKLHEARETEGGGGRGRGGWNERTGMVTMGGTKILKQEGDGAKHGTRETDGRSQKKGGLTKIC